MAGRRPVCPGGSQQGAKFIGKADFVAAGREGREARAALRESGCGVEAGTEFASLGVGPCRGALSDVGAPFATTTPRRQPSSPEIATLSSSHSPPHPAWQGGFWQRSRDEPAIQGHPQPSPCPLGSQGGQWAALAAGPPQYKQNFPSELSG